MVKPDFSKIPKGSTLDEMASFFEVEKDYLRRYHNIYCDLDDLIENEIPRHLVKLFVQPKNKEYERVLMSGQAVSAFSPADILEKSRLFHKEYGVIQTSYDNEAKSKRISFLMEIGKIDVFKYSINRKNIYINHHAPDLVLEKMAEKAGSIFFPLEVETLPNGNPCQALVTEWSGYYEKITLEDNKGKALLEDSKAICHIGGKDCITIIDHGQTSEVSSQNMKNADPEVMVEPVSVL